MSGWLLRYAHDMTHTCIALVLLVLLKRWGGDHCAMWRGGLLLLPAL